MRNLLASIFRILFLLKPVRHFYFAIDRRVFKPLRLFNGVSKTIFYRKFFRMEVQLGDWIPQQLYFLGNYEEKEILFVSKTLKDGDVFVDVGANIGIFAMVASRAVGEAGKVYAFEPFSANFNRLIVNITENNLRNVTAEQLAAVYQNEAVTLFADDNWNNNSMATAYGTSFSHGESVAGVSLDSYFRDINVSRLTLIKIDIEGGELPALRGMESLLQKFHPTILIEIDPAILLNTPYTEHEMISWLEKLGYAKKFIDKKGNITTHKMTTDNSCNYVFV